MKGNKVARGDGYLLTRELRRISEENKKIIAKLEKTRTRRNMPENEYMTEIKNSANAVEFENLHTFFFTDAGIVKSVDSVSLEVPLGRTAGVAGEPGYGKPMTSLLLIQPLQHPQGQAVKGSIRPNTGGKVREITKTPENAMQYLRGNFMSMIPQESMTSLNPVLHIGDQMDEVIMLHKKSKYPTKEAVKGCTIELLKMVGIANSGGIHNMYPHELSGGMRQRVMIAMVLARSPKLIIAGEPTIVLDVTIQAQILDLLRGLKDKINSSIILITRDPGVIAEMADHVVVMHSGRVAEARAAKEIFSSPAHPHTIGLMASEPVVGKHQDKLYSIPGKVPNPINIPNYCRSRDRRDKRERCCDGAHPGEIWLSETHRVSRYRYNEAYMGSGQSKV